MPLFSAQFSSFIVVVRRMVRCLCKSLSTHHRIRVWPLARSLARREPPPAAVGVHSSKHDARHTTLRTPCMAADTGPQLPCTVYDRVGACHSACQSNPACSGERSTPSTPRSSSRLLPNVRSRNVPSADAAAVDSGAARIGSRARNRGPRGRPPSAGSGRSPREVGL